MDKRIIEETPSTELLNDDWFIKDSPTDGTTKILGSKLKEIISGDVEDSIDKILSSIAPEWSSTSTYGFDAYVIYEGKLWRCFKDTGSTVGEFKTSEWIKAVTSGYITHVIDKIADRFVASNPPYMTYRYSVGDMVFYSEPYHDEQLYVCNTDLPQGESTFNPEHWDVVYTVAGLSKYLMDKIAEAGQIDDVQVKTTGDYESVVDENKVAKIDLSNMLIEKSVPNLPQPIASFSDGAEDLPLKSLTASIVPVQSGSGDPSPTNVRPISGWDEVDVTVCGKNLFNSTDGEYGKWYSASGSKDDNNIGYVGNYVDISFSDNFYFKLYGDLSKLYSFAFVYFDANKNFLSRELYTISSLNEHSLVIPNNAYYVRVQLSANNLAITKEIVDNSKPQLELGSTATTYEPYAGTTYTIPFTDSQGNPVEVYGGTLDVVSGVLTVTNSYFVVDQNYLIGTGGYGMPFRISTPSNIKLIDDSSVLWGGACNMLTEVAQSSSWEAAATFSHIKNTNSIYFKITDEMTDINELKTFLQSNPIQFVYELATPITIQLTPTSIKSLDGVNNVFASTGDVTELEYIANATDVIANLEARVTALES